MFIQINMNILNLLKQVSWFSSHGEEEIKVPVSTKQYFSTPVAQKNHMEGLGSDLRDSDLNGLKYGLGIMILKSSPSNSNVLTRFRLISLKNNVINVPSNS